MQVGAVAGGVAGEGGERELAEPVEAVALGVLGRSDRQHAQLGPRLGVEQEQDPVQVAQRLAGQVGGEAVDVGGQAASAAPPEHLRGEQLDGLADAVAQVLGDADGVLDRLVEQRQERGGAVVGRGEAVRGDQRSDRLQLTAGAGVAPLQRGGEVDGEPPALGPAAALGEQQPSAGRHQHQGRRLLGGEDLGDGLRGARVLDPGDDRRRQQVTGAPVAHVEEVLDAARVARLHDEQVRAGRARHHDGGDRDLLAAALPRPRRLVAGEPQGGPHARVPLPELRRRRPARGNARAASPGAFRARGDRERGVVLPWSSRSFHAVRCALTVAGNCSASQCSETRSLPTTIESNRLMRTSPSGTIRSRTRTIGSGRALRDSTSSWAWAPCRSIRRRTRVACAGASCAARASERLRHALIALAASRRGSLRVPARSRFSVSM